MKVIRNKEEKGVALSTLILVVVGTIILVVIAIFGIKHFMKKDNSKANGINNTPQIQTNSNVSNNNNSKNIGTVDSNTNLTYDKNGAFLMYVEDSFYITGKGVIASGKIKRGTINLNDKVQVIGQNDKIITATVIGIEKSRDTVQSAEIGEWVGLLLSDLVKGDVKRGQAIAKPNSIKTVKKFDADVYVFTKKEGGNPTLIVNNYTPQFKHESCEINSTITLLDGVKNVNSGGNVKMNIELTENCAIETGIEFILKENNTARIIGKGTVTKVY